MTLNSHPPSPETPQRRRLTVRRLMVAIVLCSLLFAYLASYERLKRRGMREAQDYGIVGFLYVPMADAAESESLTRHWFWAYFFAPVNWLDQWFFGAPTPWVDIMDRLGD